MVVRVGIGCAGSDTGATGSFVPSNGIVESWPLSPAQEGMLFQTLANPGSGSYIEQVSCRLDGPLDLDRFTACWQDAVARHPVLRTSFQRDGEPDPRQFVQASATVPLFQQDLSGLSPDEQVAHLDAYRTEDRHRDFDLDAAPLMRLAVFPLDGGAHEVLWTVHHLLVDGRSMNLLLREIFGSYGARIRGEEPVRGAGAPFGAYANWVRTAPESAAETFWRAHLAGVAAAVELPLPAPAGDRGGAPTHGQVRRQLDPLRTAVLGDFADRHGLTMNIVLMGAWALLAHRYCDAPDVVLGATKSVRHGPAAAPNAIGPYINTLPVRTKLDAATPLLPWLAALREQWIGLRDYEHTPHEQVRACCGTVGDASLYSMYYVFERETLGDSLRALGGEWSAREFALHEHTPVPVILAAYGGESLLLSLEYDARRIAPADAERLLGHLDHLLEAMVAEPGVLASRLAMLSPGEKRALPGVFQPERAVRDAAPTPRLFEAAVACMPDAIALRYRDQCRTYNELNQRANRLARRLRQMGVGPEVCVGVCMPHAIDAFVALLGIFKAGGVYVPMDPAYPADRLSFMLADSGAAVLIAERATLSRLETGSIQSLEIAEESAALAAYAPENLGVAIAPESLAYIIYTSGSTGRPKGVCVPHGEAARHFVAMREIYAIERQDCVLQFASLSFDVSLEQTFVALIAGAALHIADGDMYDAAAFSAVLRLNGISVVNLPPAFWQQWTDEGLVPGESDFGPQFRLLVVGGDVMLPKTARQWQRNPAAATVRLMNAYGPTETVITATYYDVPREFGAGEDRVPIGQPIPGTEAIVLDRFGNPVPPGLPGELYLGGNRLARGYHNRDELTAQYFIPHPFQRSPGARLYRTGDRVRQLADGNYEYLGRVDDQVKVRGFRIELREIEVALLRCEGVREAAVRCRADAAGDPRLAAYVVPVQGHAVDVLALRRALRETLPDYMIPSGITPMESFPVTVNGKVDYRALPDPSEEPPAALKDCIAPRTATEEAVAAIWRDILHRDQVGMDDSFFDLGGHSLSAARVVTRIRAELGAQVALGEFLQAPTIAALADTIDGTRGENTDDTGPVLSSYDPCVVPIRATGANPPLFCALGAGGAVSAYGTLVRHLGAEQPVYGLQYSHLPEFRDFSSVECVAERYLEALRTVQPAGPYFLAGWSFGGLVAYELARRLRLRGEEIALLAIIDCEARVPGATLSAPMRARVRRHLCRLGKRLKIVIGTRATLWLHARDMVRLIGQSALGRRRDGASLREYLQFVRGNLINVYALKQGGLEVPGVQASRLDMLADDFVKKVVAGLQANEAAAKAYAMAPYLGVVTLFCAETTGGDGSADPTRGYGRIADDVEVAVIKGNHYTLVKEPAVRQLAERLQERLAAARESVPVPPANKAG